MDGKEVSTVSELDTLLNDIESGNEPKEPEVSDDDVSDEPTEDLDDDEEEKTEEPEEPEEPEDVEDPDKSKEDDEGQKKNTTKKTAKKAPKDHHAFAAMRKQNKQLQEALDNLARGLGIDPKEDDALEKLNDLAYNGIAKRSGKKKEDVIADSKAQKELEAYRQKDIQRHAQDSLMRIKEEFGVDNDKLADFASKVSARGYQLLGQKEDWVGMYKNIYFDEIVQERVDKAVEEALKRDEAADKNSGKSKKRSKTNTGGKKIESVSDLDKFLDGL